MAEILFNSKIGEYTFSKEIEGVRSIKKIPMKFKFEDSTSRFRKEFLRKEILEKN